MYQTDIAREIAERSRLLRGIATKSSCGSRVAFKDARRFAKARDRDGALLLAQPEAKAVATDEKTFSATACITSLRKDREGDVVMPQGIRLDNYVDSPVWLWAHKAEEPPVGTADDGTGNLAVRLGPERAFATCRFSQSSKFAEQVGSLVMEKIIRSVSIGFQPIRAEKIAPDMVKGHPAGGRALVGQPQSGWRFDEVDLLEISWVSVGMNPDAVAVTLGKGVVAGSALHPILRRSLTPFAARRKGLVTSGWSGDSPSRAKAMQQQQPQQRQQTKQPMAEETADRQREAQGEGTGGQDVQAVFVPKTDAVNDSQKAADWAKRRNFDGSNPQYMDADPQTGRPAGWLFEQFPHQELANDRFEKLEDGAVAIVGERALRGQHEGKGRLDIAVRKDTEEGGGQQQGGEYMAQSDDEALEELELDDEGGDDSGDDDQEKCGMTKDHAGGTQQMMGRTPFPKGMAQAGVEKAGLTHAKALADVLQAGYGHQEDSEWVKICQDFAKALDGYMQEKHADAHHTMGEWKSFCKSLDEATSMFPTGGDEGDDDNDFMHDDDEDDEEKGFGGDVGEEEEADVDTGAESLEDDEEPEEDDDSDADSAAISDGDDSDDDEEEPEEDDSDDDEESDDDDEEDEDGPPMRKGQKSYGYRDDDLSPEEEAALFARLERLQHEVMRKTGRIL